MTQEQKELLLKDLCARLPYGVVIQEKCVERDKTFLPNKEVDRLVNIDTHTDLLMTNCGSWYHLEEVKPYLFPLSSMTEEQTEELMKLINTGQNDNNEFMRSLCRIEFYHKHHFDYRGLIPMDLANDATRLNIY